MGPSPRRFGFYEIGRTPPLPDLDYDRNQPSLAGPLIPPALNRVPLSTDSGFHALLDPNSSLRQPFSLRKGPFGRRR